MARVLPPQPLRSRPTVSVVIPCYNYGRYLAECVGTVLDQSGVEIVSVVIVDDASPDGSVATAREVAATDPRIRVIEHEVNKGPMRTFNDGVAAVIDTAEYILLISADDLIAPGSLERSLALLEEHPEVGLVYGHCPTFTDTPPPQKTGSVSWTLWTGVEWLEHVCRSAANPVSTPDAVLRASLLKAIGEYDERVPHAADMLMWLHAGARGAVGRINGVDQSFYRMHGENMHVTRFGTVLADLDERYRAFQILFDEVPQPDAERLRALANRALAREALTVVCRAQETGRHGDEPADELIALAQRACPPSVDPALWQTFERRRSRSAAGPVAGVRRAIDGVADDVHGRLRWRRWRRTGLYNAVRTI